MLTALHPEQYTYAHSSQGKVYMHAILWRKYSHITEKETMGVYETTY